MRVHSRVLLVYVVSFAASAVGVSAPLQAQRGQPLRQFRADSFFIRDWVRGGKKEPDLMVEPRELATTQQVLVVLDLGTREVHGLDLATGVSRFVLRATGEGPGEFRQPTHIATTAQHIGVLDGATSRLTVFSEAGRYLWTTPIVNGPAVESMCLLPRGVLRVKFMGAVDAIATIDSSGKMLSRTSLPVPLELRNAPSFANFAVIADGCAASAMAVTPYFGSAWYSLAPNGSAKRFLYREAGLEAVVTTKLKRRERVGSQTITQSSMTTDVDAIARGALQHGDTIIIEAGGTKITPNRLLDYYLASTGAYLYSRRLPIVANGLAFSAGGQLYVTSIGTETSAIVRFSTTTRSPREIARQRSRK